MATRNPGESPPFVPPQVHFPGDEGAHPEMLTEWWYGNFAVTDPNGREYGAMVTYGNPGGIRILSISDLEAKHFYHEVSMSTPDYARGILDLRWGSDDRWFRTNPDLEIKARYPEQEIQMSQALGFTHALWEGRTTALGELAGKAVSGTGYAELIRPPADVSESVPSA